MGIRSPITTDQRAHETGRFYLYYPVELAPRHFPRSYKWHLSRGESVPQRAADGAIYTVREGDGLSGPCLLAPASPSSSRPCPSPRKPHYQGAIRSSQSRPIRHGQYLGNGDTADTVVPSSARAMDVLLVHQRFLGSFLYQDFSVSQQIFWSVKLTIQMDF